EARDRLWRADVAAVGLERDTHAAERLEAIAQEQELRLGVGRSAPVFTAEKRRADLDLAIIGAHVEEARRADHPARRLPDLREDDRLAPGHQILGLADQRESLVERLWRRPREVATDVLVLHDVEEAAGVPLRDRLQGEIASLERDGRERRESRRHDQRVRRRLARGVA